MESEKFKMEEGKGKPDRKSARGRERGATGACTIKLVTRGGDVGSREGRGSCGVRGSQGGTGKRGGRGGSGAGSANWEPRDFMEVSKAAENMYFSICHRRIVAPLQCFLTTANLKTHNLFVFRICPHWLLVICGPHGATL